MCTCSLTMCVNLIRIRGCICFYVLHIISRQSREYIALGCGQGGNTVGFSPYYSRVTFTWALSNLSRYLCARFRGSQYWVVSLLE